jgi:hypothetical protein
MRLALVGTGLATALAAAEMVTKPDDVAMARAITRQRIAAAEAPRAAPDRQSRPMTPDDILAASESYENQIKQTLEHGETLRVNAYRLKDIIRITCVDEKLGQMKQIAAIAKPRFTSIKQTVHDQFHMLSQFTVIREGWERISQLAEEMEACTGDSLDAVSAAKIMEEQHGPGEGVADPTLPPNPTTNDVERPAQASPYL